MAVWWPSSGSPCRADLLTVSQAALREAIACTNPLLSPLQITSVFLPLWEQAQQLRALGSFIGQIAVTAEQVTNTAQNILRNELPSTIEDVAAFLRRMGLDAQTALRRDLAAQGEASQSIFDKIIGGVQTTVSGAGRAVTNIIDRVAGEVGNVIDGVGDSVSGIVNTVKGAVGGAISQSAAFINGIISTVRTTVGDAIEGATDFLRQAIGTAATGIREFVETAGGVIGGTITTVREFIRDLVSNVQTGIAGLVEKITSIPGALLDVAGDIIAAVGGAVDEAVTGIVGGLGNPLTGIIGGFFHGEEPVVLSMVDRVYDRLLANPATPADLRQLVTDARTPGAPIPAIVGAVIIPFIIISALSSVFAGQFEAIRQESFKITPSSLLGIGDLIQASVREFVTDDYVAEHARRLGFDADKVRIARRLAEQLPTPTDLADWRHRGFIQDGQMVERLQLQGWTPADATHILDASEVLPPIGDLVRFAVREAFPGQVGFSGARGSGFPARFAELAKMQGLDIEFAQSYWAAHWELPSVTAAFSMYHRGIIDEADLRQLLKEQDLAPEWIDRLISVAFDPLTRVDVRRMFAIGVLSKPDVVRAYRDLGYNQRNANLLADFVELDVADSARVETQSERDLTRGDIVGAYADGILSRPQASSALRDLGYDADESELVLDREDIRVLRAERKETRTAIVDQAVANVITFDQAQDKLNAAGYTTDEVTAAMREIERKIAGLIKQPTKAELDRFRKAAILSDDEYREELRRLGYSDRWIEAFVALGTAVGGDNA